MSARRLRLVGTSIDNHTPASTEPLWTPAAEARPVAEPRLHRDVEAAIIATLSRPLRTDENYQTGNANRELELYRLFDTLDALQARELLQRLDADRPTDTLARAFARLVIDRRSRLRSFLADTRRRHARRAR